MIEMQLNNFLYAYGYAPMQVCLDQHFTLSRQIIRATSKLALWPSII